MCRTFFMTSFLHSHFSTEMLPKGVFFLLWSINMNIHLLLVPSSPSRHCVVKGFESKPSKFYFVNLYYKVEVVEGLSIFVNRKEKVCSIDGWVSFCTPNSSLTFLLRTFVNQTKCKRHSICFTNNTFHVLTHHEIQQLFWPKWRRRHQVPKHCHAPIAYRACGI